MGGKTNGESFTRIRLVPYWNVKSSNAVYFIVLSEIRLVPYWNVKDVDFDINVELNKLD